MTALNLQVIQTALESQINGVESATNAQFIAMGSAVTIEINNAVEVLEEAVTNDLEVFELQINFALLEATTA